jgi:hypothetical protein
MFGMTRYELVEHLYSQDCEPDADNDSEVAELWRNLINGEVCYVPYEDVLALTTYCHIFYELKIDPPLENGYDSDYAVYVSFREMTLVQTGENEPKSK